MNNNPLINRPKHKHGAIDFNAIKLEHFMPALNHAIEEAERNLQQVKNNPSQPNFKNTLIPMETSSELMKTVANVYFNLMGAESDNKFKELAQEISPKLSGFHNSVLMDSELFKRVKYVYDNRDSENLTIEENRIIEEGYKDFTLNGALLSSSEKEKV